MCFDGRCARSWCAVARPRRSRGMELLLEDEAAAEVFAAPAAGGAGGGERVHVLLPSDVCGGTPLCCPGCGRAFKNAQNLALHARSHPPGLALPRAPPPRRGRFHCCEPACPYAPGRKSLADFKSATKHYAQKHADKTLSCAHPGCTARFAKAHQLNRHRKARRRVACRTMRRPR